jgi:hypothetical protein
MALLYSFMRFCQPKIHDYSIMMILSIYPFSYKDD